MAIGLVLKYDAPIFNMVLGASVLIIEGVLIANSQPKKPEVKIEVVTVKEECKCYTNVVDVAEIFSKIG